MLNMKRHLILLTAIATLSASMAHAKRLAPKEVTPVEHDGIQYVVVHFGVFNNTGQNGGYIEARDKKTKKKIWGLQVYKTEYDKNLESDVQDVFITGLKIDKDRKILIVENEGGKVYHVDIMQRKVVPAPEDTSKTE